MKKMNKMIIGIDPGFQGGISLIHDNGYEAIDMPTINTAKGKKQSTQYDLPSLAGIFINALKSFDVIAYVEKVHAMPKQGVVSQFNFGMGYGILLGILAALQIPYTLVTPQKWKKEMMAGTSKDKGASVLRAGQLFPNAELKTSRGKLLDGRAEALLIGQYGRLQCGIT